MVLLYYIIIQTAETEKLRFSFDIIIASSEQHKTLYCKSLEERDSWVAAIRVAGNVHNIEDYYEIGAELGMPYT